ncbi:MAG: hypothetical protein JKX84_02060 [Flavobacteriales bacterium]|nr:hypothetical protein [Flavobacteriales bacterium]
MSDRNHTIEVKGKNPLVILDLKQYQTLLDDLEDMQDRIAILERTDEPEVSQIEVEKAFAKKFGK